MFSQTRFSLLPASGPSANPRPESTPFTGPRTSLWSLNMAEFDFGDTELFDQFEKAPVAKHIRFSDVDEEPSDKVHERLVACEATIDRLNAENILIMRVFRLRCARAPV